MGQSIQRGLRSGVPQGIRSELLPGFHDLFTPRIGASGNGGQQGGGHFAGHPVQPAAGVFRREFMVFVIVGGAEFRLADRPRGKLPPDFFQQADFQPPGGRQIHLPQQGGIHGRFPSERVAEGREKLEHRQRAGP